VATRGGGRRRGNLIGSQKPTGLASLMAGRKSEGKGRPLPRLALHGQGTVLGLGQFAGDGQAQAGARAAAGFVAAIEAVEDMGQVGRTDAGTGIGHLDGDVAVVDCCG